MLLLPEQFDIHGPAVEMARSHIKQRPEHLVSVLLPGGGDYYHQHLKSAQYFPFPCCLLSAFLWLLHPSAIDVGLHSTAPPRTTGLSLAIFCLRGLKHRFFLIFLLRSRAATVENETFTILLGCKSELRDPKQGWTCNFHETNSQWILLESPHP